MNTNWNNYFTDIYNRMAGNGASCSCSEVGNEVNVVYSHSDFRNENDRIRIKNHLISKFQNMNNDEIKYNSEYCYDRYLTFKFTK